MRRFASGDWIRVHRYGIGILLAALAAVAAATSAAAAESLLRAGDVVAFVGGEDLGALAEQSQLEYLLLRSAPQHPLKFRSLAREGDTVFQQPRDLNYPNLEQQLDEIGATVVVLQFGQMESLAGEGRLAEFTAAYDKLIDRLSAGGKRRVVLIAPTPIARTSPARARFRALEAYTAAIRGLAQRRELRCLVADDGREIPPEHFRDGIHLNDEGLRTLAGQAAQLLGTLGRPADITRPEEVRLLELIRRKNLLWFHYSRPQNWAFLNGDRTIQPSSRDHLDPSIRWFPEEMKQWLPLIAREEAEISKLARSLGPIK